MMQMWQSYKFCSAVAKLPRFLVAWQYWSWSFDSDRGSISPSVSSPALIGSRCSRNKYIGFFLVHYYPPAILISLEWIWFIHLVTSVYPLTNHVLTLFHILTHLPLNICKLSNIRIICNVLWQELLKSINCCIKIFFFLFFKICLFWTWLLLALVYWEKL